MNSIKNSDDSGATRGMGEYLINVYTGDRLGEDTNANVYIVLFGDKAYSNRIILTETYDHRNPFEKWQADTFKIITDLLGSLYKIEIGFDEEKPGTGWYLEKVEISKLANNEIYVFSCNRWLSLGTGTVVKLYKTENQTK
ncbi:lipoxygenase homology domain-containing protein 1-like [Rhinoraja longicauda]